MVKGSKNLMTGSRAPSPPREQAAQAHPLSEMSLLAFLVSLLELRCRNQVTDRLTLAKPRAPA
jgi:hypothetical protein